MSKYHAVSYKKNTYRHIDLSEQPRKFKQKHWQKVLLCLILQNILPTKIYGIFSRFFEMTQHCVGKNTQTFTDTPIYRNSHANLNKNTGKKVLACRRIQRIFAGCQLGKVVTCQIAVYGTHYSTGCQTCTCRIYTFLCI